MSEDAHPEEVFGEMITKPTRPGWFFEARMLAFRLMRFLGLAVFLASVASCGGLSDSSGLLRGTDGREFAWPGAPKVVYFSAPEAYRSSFDAALNFWNRELGVTALVAGEDPEAWDVYVSAADAWSPDGWDLLWRHWVRVGGERRAELSFIPSDIGTVYTHLCHLLGHAAFGLADDSGSGSVMVPQSAEQRFVVTDEDRARVRAELMSKP